MLGGFCSGPFGQRRDAETTLGERRAVKTGDRRRTVDPLAVISRRGPLSEFTLRLENLEYQGTAGVSRNNHDAGFRPAYRNIRTGQTVISCFANGEPAPVHVLEGLPDDWVVARGPDGGVTRVCATVIAGFVRDGRFFSREAAVREMAAGDAVDGVRR